MVQIDNNMKQKYHYVWFWQCVDLCNGGAKSKTYDTRFLAICFKPQKGIWQLKRKRVYDTKE